MNDNFAIGATNLNRNTFSKAKWHKLAAGDNYYRILPPMFSLAADGRISQYWAFHGGFKNTQGVTQMFKCIETKDKNTKLIKDHCPICDLVAKLDSHYKRLKDAQAAGQATEEQVKKFWDTQIFPIKAQKTFFVNAVNRQNEVGILALPYKAHQALEATLKSAAEKYAINASDIEGAWLNIKKVQPFPGSPQVSYGAEPVFEAAGNGSFAISRHVLTAEFIQQQVKTGARDLKTLFREISPEDMAQLAAVQPEQRAQLVDRIFSKQEANVETSPLTVQAPGTQATLVGHVQPTPNGGYQVNMPTLPATTPVAQTAPPAPPVAVAPPPTAPPTTTGTFAPPPAAPVVAAPVQQPPASEFPIGQTAVGGAPAVSSLSDDAFRALFGQ